ncbi:MAG: sugar transferase [Lachnospiraceae bacterium]
MKRKNTKQMLSENVKKNAYEKYIKRGCDIILSFAGLIFSTPILVIASILIFIDDPGPVLFTQKRVGENKKYFKLHKLRSMKLSTPHDVPTHLLENPEQYILKCGHTIRRLSIDELPQLWDIFVGNMSIIGPRPALWNQYDLIEERDKYGANDIKPGLTGWAQINGRDELEIPVKARLDGEYTECLHKSNFSAFMMDIKCFFGTILSVLRSDGVVEGGTGEMKKKEDITGSSKKLLAITNHSYMFWQFRRELMAELQKEYEVVISTPFVGHEDDFAAMGCRMIETDVDRRGMNPKTDLKLFRTYYQMLKTEKPDMVITYSIKPNVYAGFACSTLNIPYCVNVQGLGTAFQKEPMASVVSIMYRIACRKAKTVFFENQGNAKVFTERKIVPASKITVLPGAGVNLDYYAYAPYPEHKETRFLYLGRIMKEKGIDELFYAIRKLHDEYGDQVKLDLVGFFEDEYKEQVEQLVQDGIAEFHGFQQDPRPFYANADCVVLPSYHEGMSNVLLEAAATGRCIVTSDIPGCREAVDSGKSGLLCKVKDQESLYEQMKQVMGLSKEKLKQIGESGREKMTVEFCKEMVVEMTREQIWGRG